MRLSDRQYDIVALTAFAAVAPHLPRLPLWFAIAIVVAAALRVVARRRSTRVVPAWVRVPLVGLLVIAVVSQYGNLFGREPGSALAAGLLMLKLVETEKLRDARATLGFSAFVLMSALLFTQTLAFTVALCAVLVLLLAALHALQPAPLDPSRPLRSGLRSGGALVGLGLPLAAAAFLLIPRLGSPLWGSPGGDELGRTGLDDRMSPGGLTELLVDDSPALRVRFDGAAPTPAQRYFRAIVLSDFDGTTWTRDRQFPESAADTLEALSAPLAYEITIEPTDRPWVPVLDLPVEAPENTRLSNDRVVTSRGALSTPRRFRASSVTDYRFSTTLRDDERRRALHLPDGFNPRAIELARRWRAESGGDDGVMRAALANFNASFSYTLSPPPLGRHSVDDFLFDTQAGYCEHYSAAFVVLMRAAGIPARVVTGYQGGWMNQGSGYLLVRQSDAHAWSEVWLESRGWVRVDPTAAVSPERIERGAPAANRDAGWFGSEWWLEARNRLDVVNRLWTDTIVQFNALRQRSLLTPFGVRDADQGDLLRVLACVVAVVLGLATWWVMRSPRDVRGDALDAAWRRLQRRALRRGLDARDGEGPLDWLERARARIVDATTADRLAAIVRDYVTLRYAHAEPPPEQVDAFARAVRELKLPRAVILR
ncbi:transglutaminase TgpA family protein [Dokdonella sp. MW10]|uniref:transglutaminase TgpA family protein n=1 Tax=Dokdonella sp. MW10 TaxID=2992926 RepID=UPI003F7D2859